MDEVEIVDNVEDAGFTPKRRNMHYEILGDPVFRERERAADAVAGHGPRGRRHLRARGAQELSRAQPPRKDAAPGAVGADFPPPLKLRRASRPAAHDDAHLSRQLDPARSLMSQSAAAGSASPAAGSRRLALVRCPVPWTLVVSPSCRRSSTPTRISSCLTFTAAFRRARVVHDVGADAHGAAAQLSRSVDAGDSRGGAGRDRLRRGRQVQALSETSATRSSPCPCFGKPACRRRSFTSCSASTSRIRVARVAAAAAANQAAGEHHRDVRVSAGRARALFGVAGSVPGDSRRTRRATAPVTSVHLGESPEEVEFLRRRERPVAGRCWRNSASGRRTGKRRAIRPSAICRTSAFSIGAVLVVARRPVRRRRPRAAGGARRHDRIVPAKQRARGRRLPAARGVLRDGRGRRVRHRQPRQRGRSEPVRGAEGSAADRAARAGPTAARERHADAARARSASATSSAASKLASGRR